ncbi:SDR family NAD(P)-dependent oxidoreductase [Erwinia psidii]|uniref:SDR family oxidoreductase n=1 Tax=Erwinia psidii TaxID=69224 RepID=A0A3N6SEW6_9GAMM|nr:SDR family oxidoreductase [Erwinia psidii]MCX8957817.1 SDR family oxidoreductase [Erwinia psidii]MCX8960866.1 SDR family oxidoreductase [Erwinia psidii]MCX8964894.1 SDR family oxidoreductase [Erwinia psidii]RQM38433.1 SDR family oxidoreductase [Erwinia psidii]
MSRHALITGASSGIGAAIVARLLDEGWTVTGLSRTPVALPHPRFTSLPVDLVDTHALKQVLRTLSQVDALIHAAGMMKAAPLGQLDEESGQRLWQLHIAVAEVMANQLVDRLPAGGRIILIGSRTSVGAAGRSQYVSTKSAMKGMVRSWAAELAARGITANIVAPGATATPMLTMPGRESSQPTMPPIGRYIQPEEVAGLVSFLLSPAADAITGQEVVICGGASL